MVDGRAGGAALMLCVCLGLAPVAVDAAGLSLSSALIFSASARYACLFGVTAVDCFSCLRGVAARIWSWMAFLSIDILVESDVSKSLR